MKHKILLSFVLLTMLLASITTTRADEKTDALMAEVRAATSAAHTLTASFSTKIQFRGELQSTGTIKLMKPNLARIDYANPSAPSIVSDGKTVWTLTKEQNSYTKHEASPQGSNIDWLGTLPVNPFFDVDFVSKLAAPGNQPRLSGIERVKGKDYSVIEATVEKPATMKIKLYIGDDKLVHRVTTEFPADDEFYRTETELHNVVIENPMWAKDFRFDLPDGAQLLPPPTFSNGNPKLLRRGTIAPNFTLPTLGDGTISLADTLKGKRAVLVNFWFYGCAPCREEFPRLQKLYDDLQDKGFDIIAINIGDSEEVIDDYLKENQLSFKVVMAGEPGSEHFGILKQYSVTGFPTNYLLDEEGKIVFRSVGYGSDYELRGRLEEMGVR